MLKVSKLIERLEAATDPFKGYVGDTLAIIKLPNTRWGPSVVINELISLKLAKRLNIPIPNGGICEITKETETQEVEQDLDYGEDILKICFFSEMLKNTVPISKSIKTIGKIGNKCDINKIVLFDHVIYNKDRHEGNILIQHGIIAGEFKMSIIDHSHIFKIGYNWNKEKLLNLIEQNDFKDDEIMKLNNDTLYKFFFELGVLTEKKLYEEVENFKNIITKDCLDEICREIPKAWNIGEEDIEEVKEYILYRVSHLDDCVRLIIDYSEGV